MRISDLITKLQNAQRVYGDIDVMMYDTILASFVDLTKVEISHDLTDNKIKWITLEGWLMTIAELIAKLQEFDPTLEVRYNDPESFEDNKVEEVDLFKDYVRLI